MHEVVSQANNIISLLDGLSPGWYLVAVAPLANIAQHLLKLERDEQNKLTPGQNKALSIGLAALGGAFFGVLHTPEGQAATTALHTWAVDSGLMTGGIWVITQALYHGVSKKLEQRHELLNSTATAEPADSALDASGELAI